MAQIHGGEQRFAIDSSLAGARLDVAIARTLGCSRSAARHAIDDGAVYVAGRRCRVPALPLELGQEVRVLPAAPDRTGLDHGELRVVFEDEALLVVDKPAGLPTQPPPRGGDALSLRVRKYLDEQGKRVKTLGEVHRLDRDASGLVVYGLTARATAALAEQMRTHAATRRYLALVRTALPVEAQVIAEPMVEVAPGRMTTDPTGMPATTFVMPLDFDPTARLCLVLCALETGRTHQVRVHLAWAVGPIAGDAQYGDPFGPGGAGAEVAAPVEDASVEPGQDGLACGELTPHAPAPALAETAADAAPAASIRRVALHGAVLRLEHPLTGRVVAFRSEPGPDFWALAGAAAVALPQGWADLDPRAASTSRAVEAR